MRVGLIGSGNMARGLARGWGEPVLCSDPLAQRAQELAAETGGTALASNAEVAQQADVVVLCHKPAQTEDVAREIGPHAKRVASILGGVELERLRGAYPGASVQRYLPSTPVEIRQGVVVLARGSDDDDELRRHFASLGTLVEIDEPLVDVAMGLMSCAPAYVALVAEAQIDAGVRRGIPAGTAAELVVQTLAGTAELLRAREYDTLAVRREVTSPGGSTARGLAALERGGIRAAFMDALDAVLEARR